MLVRIGMVHASQDPPFIGCLAVPSTNKWNAISYKKCPLNTYHTSPQDDAVSAHPRHSVKHVCSIAYWTNQNTHESPGPTLMYVV